MATASNNEFKLIGSPGREYPLSDVSLLCNLSPELSAVDLEIRWFKETECVYLCKTRQVTEGKGYEDRVSLFTDELEKGNVSLHLKNCSWSDLGDYLCQVTDGDRTEELTVRMTGSRPVSHLKTGARSETDAAQSHEPQIVFIMQTNRKWTKQERLRMEKSLFTKYNNLISEFKKKCSNLERTEEELKNTKLELEQVMQTNQNKLETLEKELQDKNSKIQEIMILMEQPKTELAENNKELEEKQQMDKDKQLQEEDNEAQPQERTDPVPSVPIRRTNSIDFMSPSMSGESSGVDPSESVPVTELRLVLLGRSGPGKTAAGNIILGREERSQAGTSTPTQQSESTQGELAGRKVTVMNTPDWFCSELPLDKLRQDVGCCIRLSAPGPHAFLLVLPVKQAAGEERAMLEKMEEIFGDRCWRNTMILFTVSDEIQKKKIEAFIQSGNQEVQRLVEKCGNRFHCINIKQSGDGSQVSELLEKIEKMERFYSSEIYLETESQIRAMEAMILKERGEKRKKEESVMKEKLFSERETQQMDKDMQVQEKDKHLKDAEDELEKLKNIIKQNQKQLENNDQERQANQIKLETLEEELQDKNGQIQEMSTLMEQQKTELSEKNKELEEKERLLSERERQQMDKDKQIQEKDKQLKDAEDELEKLKNIIKQNQKQLEKNDQERQTNQIKLETLEEELQDKTSQIQEMSILMEQQKTELSEKNKELEERERLLSERERQQMDKGKQIQEKDHLKEDQPKEHTDPDPSVPIRRNNSMELLDPKMSGESSGADPPESVPVTELRLVLLGRSGSGKTAAGNTILGREERSQAGTATPTQQSESTQGEVAGRKVTVMNTPDWFCSELPLDKLRQDVGRCIHLSAPGPHAFLLVLPVKQATEEEGGKMEKMEEIFGDRCWRNTMILFTVSDELQKENIKAFIKSGNQEVQRLVEKCGNRFHCINIKQSGDGSQVSELLEKIEKMERFYSGEIYLETESQIRAMEAMILKERGEKRMKEERQMKEKLEKEVDESLRKIEGVIQEHESDIRQLNDRTTELERKMKEERDEEKKRELEKELEREVERRTEMEKKVNRLKEKRVKERRDMEEKHEQNMEELREMYEGEARMEAEKNLMKIIMPKLQRNILASKTKMQEEFSQQMEEKDLEMEKLKQRLSELTQTYTVLEEVYERTVKSTAEAEGAAPAEQSKGIAQKFMGLFR